MTRTVVVSRSTIAGPISRGQFTTAIALLEQRFSILQSVFRDGCFVERPASRAASVDWYSRDAMSPEALYDLLLNTDLDTEQQIYAAYAIDNGDSIDAFLHTSHAITDATSLVELHSFLAYLCDCVISGTTPAFEVQAFPPHVDGAVEHCLSLLEQADAAGLPASYDGSFALLPLHDPAAGPPVRHRLERLVIEPDEMRQISDAAHRHGVSVHSVLVAAFALAIRDVADERPPQILMRSSIDMRRRLEPHVSVELVFSAITGHITHIPDLDRPILALAGLVFSDIRNGVADGRIFHDYRNYPRSFGAPGDVPVALNISDMGTIHYHQVSGQTRDSGFEYALGWLKKFPNVSVSINDGRLVANTVYVEEFVAPPVMRRMSELVRQYLRAAREG
ncbi:MAG: hypothetical protein WDN25_07780 [Acetobacteraceae bacterium]